MSKPKISKKEPTGVTLEAGKNYAWCTCGESATQPFCDGAHKGTGFTPNVFKQEESKEAWLCNCKQTQNPPFCDGSHNNC